MEQQAIKKPNHDVVNRIERLMQVGNWRLDLETQNLYWSDEVYAIHGISPFVYTPDVHTAIDAYLPKDREHVRAVLERAIEHGEGFMFQAKIMHGDGSIRTVAVKGECEKNNKGEMQAVFGSIQDITEHTHEQELYERAILGSNTAVWSWDMRMDVIRWMEGSHKAIGFKASKDLAENSPDFFSKMVHEDDELRLKNELDVNIKNNENTNIQIRLKQPEGSYIWVIMTAQSQKDRQGQTISLSGSLTNIDQLKKAEEKLIRSNQDLEQFASIAAHDLQQPLRSISGFLELLNEKYEEQLDEKAQEYIAYAVEGAHNMSELIADLLEYSRLETAGIQKKKIKTKKLIEDSLKPLTALIQDTQAEIIVEEMPSHIVCDQYKLQRVFYNLIENALKYRSKKQPKITITCKKIDSNWLFTIQDNGIGIPAKKLDEIFLMFNRLHNKSKYSGTGIGLSICKKVVELHGGIIWATAKRGKGTAFHFEVPE